MLSSSVCLQSSSSSIHSINSQVQFGTPRSRGFRYLCAPCSSEWCLAASVVGLTLRLRQNQSAFVQYVGKRAFTQNRLVHSGARTNLGLSLVNGSTVGIARGV